MNELEADKTKKIATSEEIIAKVPREAFKAMFYMFTGRPDSAFKSFYKPIVISKDDIIELNDSIQEKLRNYSIDAAMTTVTITFENNKSIDFAIWDEFANRKFNIPDVTETVTIKWDFLIKLPTYNAPQRHTLVVKATSQISPLQFVQALSSRDHEALDKFELEAVPCFARVDFINHILSDELLMIVEKWNEARKLVPCVSSFWSWLKKNDSNVARIIHYLMPFFGIILGLAILHKYVDGFPQSSQITTIFVRNLMYWLLLTGVGILGLNIIGNFLGSNVYRAINRYGKFHIFALTNGDSNKALRISSTNRRLTLKFVSASVVALVWGTLSSIVATILCKWWKIG